MLKKNDIEPFPQRNREPFDGTLRMNLNKSGPVNAKLGQKKTRGGKWLLSSTSFVFHKGPVGLRLLLRFCNS